MPSHVQVPVVGLTPLKSLEQVGPLAIFFFFQVRRTYTQDEGGTG